MVPKLWEDLDTAAPQGVRLTLDEAFAFLKEWVWVLEDGGYKVIVPAWWTPQGRRRVKIRLRSAPARKATRSTPRPSGLSLENLVQYSYQLAIGDAAVSEEEWRRLVESKAPWCASVVNGWSWTGSECRRCSPSGAGTARRTRR